uniref:Ubiquitin-like domain-containing protein n=1 Tax=Heterorhabditis bacteriophora TaxID=37862 RepID=A0A1I7XST2_HETBA
MSETSPSPGKEGDRQSSGNSSASPTRQRELIEITVKSVMDNVPEKKLLVPSNCLVYDLKVIICKSSGILPEKQLLLYNDEELK